MLYIIICLNYTESAGDDHYLIRQLSKKIEIYDYYFAFLKLISIWNKLNLTHYNNGMYPTKHILLQFGEKLHCAKDFTSVFGQSLYLQAALSAVSKSNVVHGSNSLISNNNYLCNQISQISDVLAAIIVGVLEDSHTVEIDSYEECTRLLLIAYDSIRKYRQSKVDEYKSLFEQYESMSDDSNSICE
ncbi:unnamed protein product, partial [Didymodactylos carnosus]